MPDAARTTASIFPVAVIGIILEPTVVTFINAHERESPNDVSIGLIACSSE